MPVVEPKPAAETLTLRLDRKLKHDFTAFAAKENRAASEVLRELMLAYVQRRERQQFEAEARRQSALASSSFDEKEVMLWFEEVWNMDGWH